MNNEHKKAYIISGGVLAGSILFAGVVSLIILASSGGSTGDGKRPARPGSMPAAEMLERYAKGRVDAEIFYNDKTLTIEGTVQRVYEDDTGTETGVMLAERTADKMPIAIVGQFFGRGNRNRVLSLRPGDWVAIRGQCKGNFQSGRTGLYHVILHGATIAERQTGEGVRQWRVMKSKS